MKKPKTKKALVQKPRILGFTYMVDRSGVVNNVKIIKQQPFIYPMPIGA